jgi:hypothetical protein
MTSTRKLESQLDRIRSEENALLVLIIKPDWGYISTMPGLRPEDAIETLRNEIPALADYLIRKSTAR